MVSTVYHDAATVKRHFDFNIAATQLFERYSQHIIGRYKEILTSQDKHMRSPLHYAAMSKFTLCFKSLQALLEININSEPEYSFFEHLYFEIAALDRPDKTTPMDPRKSANLIAEFEHLLDPKEFKRINKQFKSEISKMVKEALDT